MANTVASLRERARHPSGGVEKHKDDEKLSCSSLFSKEYAGERSVFFVTDIFLASWNKLKNRKQVQ